MLFIANALPFNGGTTFILRLCRELSARGEKVGVLVLFDEIDRSLEEEIKKYAEIYYLKDFAPSLCRLAFKSQLGSFLPLNFNGVDKIVEKYGRHVHVMGVFGLLFIARYLKKGFDQVRLSVGIYHQNEFMFSKVSHYFAEKSKDIFSRLKPESVVFFNEINRDSFASFFGNNYDSSTLVPIGIDTPKTDRDLTGDSNSCRIISIGNLFNFKTYNRHIISCFPELLKINPRLVYEIYGAGPYEPELRRLVSSLDLKYSVLFNGRIAYERMPAILNGALVFVGSGTAIVEASALGVPSIIGIESSAEAVTFGFLSDIPGFSYNEMSDTQEIYLIKDKMLEIMSGPESWASAAISCKKKAMQFSIVHTADGFIELEHKKMFFNEKDVGDYSNFISLVSVLFCALKLKFGLDNGFMDRRNQGEILDTL